jgi:hypothetical protein
VSGVPEGGGANLAVAEVRVRLGALLRGVRAAVGRRDGQLAGLPESASPVSMSREHAAALLTRVEEFAERGRVYGPGAALTTAERARIDHLDRAARARGELLPSRRLRAQGLDELDLGVLLLVAAPSLYPAFGTLYAYLNDVRSPACTVHLAVDVLASGLDSDRAAAVAAGPYGVVRSAGWVQAWPVERSTSVVLRPADGVLELLLGAEVDAALVGGLSGSAVPPAPSRASGPPTVDRQLVEALAAGRLDVVGVWGPGDAGGQAVHASLATLRTTVTVRDDWSTALQRAALERAVCVARVPDDPAEAVRAADLVSLSSAPVVLWGERPLRSLSLMTRRRYAEVSLPTTGFAERRASWSEAFPVLTPESVDDLAARFRLGSEEIAAVAALHAAAQGWARNGDRPQVEDLARLVSRRVSSQVAPTRTPTRGCDLLVLPPAELAQVLEVAAAARAWPRVADAWRLDRFGNPGVTALFSGEPGTGKTLAAEVVAAEVGLDLMEVDVSRLVSKWLGETEKHLDAVFSEAGASNCVLFFDEADSLFGQRGEVSRGSDRYANLEVGYLLQRLERFEGVVILASNLRANLDPAFTRRFHHLVHFPRPAEAERRRMWEIALGPPVCLAGDVDLDVLTRLELTGAGIAAIVRSASLAAGGDTEQQAALDMAGIVAAVRRQYQREARILPREQLGAYAGTS